MRVPSIDRSSGRVTAARAHIDASERAVAANELTPSIASRAFLPAPCLNGLDTARRPRLLAVRYAGEMFGAPFNLRPEGFADFAERRRQLQVACDTARSELIDALYLAIPEQRSSVLRRALLALKRSIYNGRAVVLAPSTTAVLADNLRDLVNQYMSLTRDLEDQRLQCRDALRQQYEDMFRRLLIDDKFCLAVSYASPDLFRDIREQRPENGAFFTALQRGLYEYAARFITKANPFHLLAAVDFTAPEHATDVKYEFVLAIADVLAIERDLLPSAPSSRTWLALRPYSLNQRTVEFWVTEPASARVITLRRSELLSVVLRFFEEQQERWQRPTGLLADCESYVLAHAPIHLAQEGQRMIMRLIEEGAIGRYLIPDFNRFGEALQGIDKQYDDVVASLQEVHLAQTHVATTDWVRAHAATLAATTSLGNRVHYFLNSFRHENSAEHEEAATTVYQDLSELRSLYCVEHNFSGHDYTLSAFATDYVRTNGTTSYLTMLRYFFRNRQTLIEQYQRPIHQPGDALGQLERWRAAAAAHDGLLTRDHLDALLTFATAIATPRRLCFNGPFDYTERLYYPTNVFAAGRFALRYLLQEQTRDDISPDPASAEQCVDVEIATAPYRNLNVIARRFATGCGFDARLAHRYDRWIDIGDVMVCLGANGIEYRHARSAALLRFHYVGFLLAQYLPIELQLMLRGHADSFRSPFFGLDLTPPEGVRHRASLRFGSVCLRRERWEFAPSMLAELMRDEDIVSATFRVRDWMHARLACGTDEWYYQVFGGGVRAQKPRFLDLRNPLSMHACARVLSAAPPSALLSLTEMKPQPDNLYRLHGQPVVTELMIDV